MGNNDINKFKKDIESIPIPEKLDFIIKESIRKGKKDMKKERFKKSFIKIAASVAVATVVFTATVNISPAFAEETIGRVPLISELAEMVRFMNGGKEILESGNVQHISQVCEDKGITVSVDPIIADGKNLIIPFKVIVGDEYKDVQRMMFDEIEIEDKYGKKLLSSRGIGAFEYMMGTSEDFVNGPEGREMNFQLSATWTDPSKPVPDEMILTSNKIKATLSDNKQTLIKGEWKIYIKINDTTIAKAVEYNTAGDIEFEGSTYSIESIKSYPTAVEVCIKNGNEFYQKIKGYQIFLEDEEGNRYMSPSGSSAEGKAVIEFSSVYYQNAKELFMVFVPNEGDKEEIKVKIGQISN